MHTAPPRTIPERWLPAFAGLLAAFGLIASTATPGIVWGEALFGAGTADTWGHAWGYGWTADALASGHLPFFDAPVDHPGDQRWWVIDLPVAIVLAPFTALFGSGVSYNLAILLHVSVGAGALAALCRRRGAEPAVAVVVAVLAALSPFVRGVVTSGIPEALGVLVAPLLVFWLDDALRTGHWRALVGATATAVILVLDGVYGALAGALAAAGATVVALIQSPARLRVLARAALVAGPAGLAMVGLRTALRISQHPALYDSKARTVLMGDAWILQPLGGSDLVAWVLPSGLLPLVVPNSAHRHIVYVGFLLPVLMVWAAWKHVPSRRPAAIAVIGGVLALGPALFVWGEPLTEAILPGTLLWVAGATNLYRLAGLVPVMGLLAVGLALSTRCSVRVAVLALLAVGLEWSVGTPLPLRLAATPDPAGPVEDWLRDHPRGGAVLDLPFDREGTKARGAHPQRTFYLASVHGRPIASGLYQQATMETRQPGLGAFSRSVRVGWQKQRSPAGQTPRKRTVPVPPPPRGALATDISSVLVREGFDFLTLDLALLVEDQQAGARAWATEWLGPPEVTSTDGMRMAWSIDTLALQPIDPALDTRGRPPAPLQNGDTP